MPNRQRAWVVLLAVYLAGIAVALNQMKVPPVMQVLLLDLNIDMATGGWLMSSFAVAGVVLGLPAALLLNRVGPRPAGLLALGATVAGSILGALSTNAAGLLLGRAVEGLGLGLIGVVAPAVISQWFPPAERGLPMGIWASWVPVGSFLIFNVADGVSGAYGWRGLWWLGTAVAAGALVIYAALVSVPPAAPAAPAPAGAPDLRLGRWVWHPASWILALIFATFTFAFTGYGTWSPSYLNTVLGLEMPAANFNASLSSLVVIPATIVAGWVLDRVPNRKLILALAIGASAGLLLWCFRLENPAWVAPYFILLGAVGGFIPTTAFTLAPETMPRPELAGLALGILSVGQNLGAVLGAPVIAALIAGGQWEAGTWPVVGALALGLGAIWLLRLPAGPGRAPDGANAPA